MGVNKLSQIKPYEGKRKNKPSVLPEQTVTDGEITTVVWLCSRIPSPEAFRSYYLH